MKLHHTIITKIILMVLILPLKVAEARTGDSSKPIDQINAPTNLPHLVDAMARVLWQLMVNHGFGGSVRRAAQVRNGERISSLDFAILMELHRIRLAILAKTLLNSAPGLFEVRAGDVTMGLLMAHDAEKCVMAPEYLMFTRSQNPEQLVSDEVSHPLQFLIQVYGTSVMDRTAIEKLNASGHIYRELLFSNGWSFNPMLDFGEKSEPIAQSMKIEYKLIELIVDQLDTILSFDRARELARRTRHDDLQLMLRRVQNSQELRDFLNLFNKAKVADIESRLFLHLQNLARDYQVLTSGVDGNLVARVRDKLFKMRRDSSFVDRTTGREGVGTYSCVNLLK
ncbi:MAG: hypothetical protein K1X29_09025 [Bdellovibrionales bacterium]|nr:hypothetical protein [Bdellovibrionales bacterium]